MPVITKTSKVPAKGFAITEESVREWLDENLEGSPLEPTAQLAREVALEILNAQREDNEQEPLVRCPKEAAETTLSYLQDFKDEWNSENDEDSASDDNSSEDEESVDEEESDEGRSIVKKKYKGRYRPFKMTNGDEIAQLVTAHVKTAKGEDGKPRVDEAKLEKFAKRNGCWADGYENLNVGQRRMNIGNRLRARVRKENYEIIWN